MEEEDDFQQAADLSAHHNSIHCLTFHPFPTATGGLDPVVDGPLFMAPVLNHR